jgi:hypothetical protein
LPRSTCLLPISNIHTHREIVLDPLTLITEIKSLLPAQLTGEQHQRLPFAQGQILQGIVSAKGEAQQFTLNIGGHTLSAESSAPLQVGQPLDLQVTSLTPRIELQIIGSNPITRWLGATIPLLGQQSVFMPEVNALAGDAQTLSLVSRSAQETLRFYANSTGGEVEDTATASPSLQLRELLSTIQVPLAGQNFQGMYEKISTLLQKFSIDPTLPQAAAQQSARLAVLFLQEAEAGGMQSSSLIAAKTSIPTMVEESSVLFTVPSRLLAEGAALPSSLASLAPLIKESANLPETHLLRQLLAFLVQTKTISTQLDGVQTTGRQLEDYLNRLGINMERLLADNKQEEATKTLKFALLELSQHAEAAEKRSVSPDQLAKTVELYQLLQLRLANESLIFLPLPFSFLQQGYLIADADRSHKQADAQTEQVGEKVALHVQLEGLGNLQIDIHQRDNRVSLRFLTEDAEKAKFIADSRMELEQWLTTDRLDSVQFLVGAAEPAKTLLNLIARDGAGLINTRA